MVLPVITWQGLNRFDDDLDGFPDDLTDGRRVALNRPYANGRLPLGARTQAAPLLAFLDRARLPYDLTTDVSLSEGRGPALANAPAAVLGGDTRWHPPALARRLRRQVDDGGRVAMFGADSLRRPVALEKDTASDPGGRRPTDPFGERTELSRTGEAPMRVQRPGLGLFRGTDELLGSFTLFERSVALDPRAKAEATAGPRLRAGPGGLPPGEGHRGPPGLAGMAGRAARGARQPRGPEGHPQPLATPILRPVKKEVAIIAGAVVLVVAVAVAGYAFFSDDRGTEKRGSANQEFDTSQEPAAPRRPKATIPWPTYAFDNQRTHLATGFEHRPPYKKVWRLDGKDTLEFPPTVGYGRVYLAQQKGLFFAIDGRTGKVKWKRNFKRCAASSPAVGRKTVYQGYMDFVDCPQGRSGASGFVIAMNTDTGKRRWIYRSGPVESSPLLHKRTLYFGSWDRKVHAVDARTGRRRWAFTGDEEINTSAAYSKGTIFIASDAGHAVRAGRPHRPQAVVGQAEQRVLLRHSHRGLRAGVHRQHRRHDVRLRRAQRPAAVGQAARLLHLRRRRRGQEARVHRHLRRLRLLAQRGHR